MKYMRIIALLLIVLTSCQKHEEEQKGVLRINFQEGDLPSLHPHDLMIYLRGLSIAKTLYEGLTRVIPGGGVELTGAESMECSPDHLHYTFTLRGNHWSDGTPVTADQYENAWKEALSPTSDCSRADLLYMVKNAEQAKRGEVPLDEVGIKALSPMTLAVDLEYPSPYFLELLSQPICFPLKEPARRDLPLFNGPFQVASWAKGDLLRLRQNPHFWDHQSTAITGIDVYMIEDMMTAYSLYEKGELDWMGAPLCPLSVELVDQLESKETLHAHPLDRAFWIVLNTEQPALKSSYIRQALSLAIDRDSITEHILKGGKSLYKPFPNTLLNTDPDLPLHESLAEAHEKLEKGLKELGYTKEALPPIVISYSQQAGRKQLAEYLQEVWTQKLGLRVELKKEEWTMLRSNLEKGLFATSGVFEAAFYNDPLELMERFVTMNPCNFSQWLNETYAKQILSAKYEVNPEKRKELLGEAEKILLEELPFIPVSTDAHLFAHDPDLDGYVFDYVGAIDFSKCEMR